MHELLDPPLDEISEDRLRAVLAAAGDEDGRWEAKGGTLRSEHVFRAVAGLANRDGGLLVIGATRLATGGWELSECAISGEPGSRAPCATTCARHRRWTSERGRSRREPTPRSSASSPTPPI